MKDILAFFMIVAVVAILAGVGIEFMNYLLKRRLIRSGQLDENYLRLLTRKNNLLSSLKWGILLFFGGTGLIIIGTLAFDWEQSPIPWGIETVFISAGFLIYYFIVSHKQKD
ncbi:hypothetical protein [Niabella soli]|uniref:Uncharacterized protein n=1 Tax=Niabella soli DSM 19437 TaxID=929713 RepID=W0F3R3_9BACT|nr:hypothetical protein [Niabella soli]AHF16139.1 hypothetical protein NIASO_15260 [Niabella soli DSM 19437]